MQRVQFDSEIFNFWLTIYAIFRLYATFSFDITLSVRNWFPNINDTIIQLQTQPVFF